MKHINTYINMKTINTYISEKLKINKPTNPNVNHTLHPLDRRELRDMILNEVKVNGKNCSLNHIDVSNVTNMEYVFLSIDFDGDISNWDVSNVINMDWMFARCKTFNNDISNWDINKKCTMNSTFLDSALDKKYRPTKK